MMKVKLCKVYTLDSCECQQGDENCFRYNKIRDFDTLDRQTIGAYNIQAHSRWLHAIRKGVITENMAYKHMKIPNCFCKVCN